MEKKSSLTFCHNQSMQSSLSQRMKEFHHFKYEELLTSNKNAFQVFEKSPEAPKPSYSMVT